MKERGTGEDKQESSGVTQVSGICYTDEEMARVTRLLDIFIGIDYKLKKRDEQEKKKND